MVQVFNSRVIFELTHDAYTQNKSRKWFTVSGWSKQASIHTHGCNLVWGSLRLAPTTHMQVYLSAASNIFLPILVWMSSTASLHEERAYSRHKEVLEWKQGYFTTPSLPGFLGVNYLQWSVRMADQQREGRDDSVKLFSIQPQCALHIFMVGFLLICYPSIWNN